MNKFISARAVLSHLLWSHTDEREDARVQLQAYSTAGMHRLYIIFSERWLSAHLAVYLNTIGRKPTQRLST